MKGHKCGTVEKCARGATGRNCGDVGVYAGRKGMSRNGGGWGVGTGQQKRVARDSRRGGCYQFVRV